MFDVKPVSKIVQELITVGNLPLFRFNRPIGFAFVDEMFLPTLKNLGGLWHLSHATYVSSPRLTIEILGAKHLLPLSRAVATLYKILVLQREKGENLEVPKNLSKTDLFHLSNELKVERTKFLSKNAFDCRLTNMIFHNINVGQKPVNTEVPASTLRVPSLIEEENALTPEEFDKIFGKVIEGGEVVLPEGLVSRDDEKVVDNILSNFNR